MASRFPESTPEVVWVAGEVLFPVHCGLSFPNPTPGTSYPNIVFKSNADENEPYFDRFDAAGIKVWVQVEPGDADVATLIDLVMRQYSHHPNVIGFGVDVEPQIQGLPQRQGGGGFRGAAWVAKVQSYNAAYMLFTKHWLIEKMPPTYRTGIVFVDDSQSFRGLAPMLNEFAAWGQAFVPAPVGFQYGYARDRRWWSKFADPVREIGDAIRTRVPNTRDLIWVDFTGPEIWPVP